LIYEFLLSLWKIALCSVILLLPLFRTIRQVMVFGKKNVTSLIRQICTDVAFIDRSREQNVV